MGTSKLICSTISLHLHSLIITVFSVGFILLHRQKHLEQKTQVQVCDPENTRIVVLYCVSFLAGGIHEEPLVNKSKHRTKESRILMSRAQASAG